jgi:hypothetical protein
LQTPLFAQVNVMILGQGRGLGLEQHTNAPWVVAFLLDRALSATG